jgi:hypothetical protein
MVESVAPTRYYCFSFSLVTPSSGGGGMGEMDRRIDGTRTCSVLFCGSITCNVSYTKREPSKVYVSCGYSMVCINDVPPPHPPW